MASKNSIAVLKSPSGKIDGGKTLSRILLMKKYDHFISELQRKLLKLMSLPKSRLIYEGILNIVGQAHEMVFDEFFDSFAFSGIFKLNITHAMMDARSLDRFADVLNNFNVKNVLEVGSGRGFFAKLLDLSRFAGKVFPTDAMWSHGSDESEKFTSVEKLTASDAVDKHKDSDCLLVVWPSQNESWMTDALRNYRKTRGKQQSIFAHIGGQGLTGDKSLYKEIKENWQFCEEIPVLNWPGDDTALTVYIINPSKHEPSDAESSDEEDENQSQPHRCYRRKWLPPLSEAESSEDEEEDIPPKAPTLPLRDDSEAESSDVEHTSAESDANLPLSKQHTSASSGKSSDDE